ncbi:MAG: hypothetical protein LBT46_01385 [Planctomycetaceae bacterium]|jgi:hypothetical protein|nr:hypothetical protein [Planctomycetaceae bacterium]
MLRLLAVITVFVACSAFFTGDASAQQAYGQNWAATNTQDWQRFYHYPYVYYPHNYYTPEYYQSSQDLYHRYPAEMRVPAYDKGNVNFYPSSRRYHSGNHFRLDIF